jgi:hypothetical protein
VSEKLKSTAIEALGRFNEKADKLESSSFLKTILSEPLRFRVHIDITQKRGTSSRTGPEGESIEAFVNTFRQFCQDNDQVGFRNMARLYEKLRAAELIPENLAGEFKEVRSALNRYLDSDTFITFYGSRLTHRRLFDVFLYGYLSHNNPQKRAVYDQWKAEPIFPWIEGEFIATMVEFSIVISRVRYLNERALEEITARTT